MKLPNIPKLKPVWEYTTKQQVLMSLAVLLVLFTALATIPAVVGILFVLAFGTFCVWGLVFKMIPGIFFDRF